MNDAIHQISKNNHTFLDSAFLLRVTKMQITFVNTYRLLNSSNARKIRLHVLNSIILTLDNCRCSLATVTFSRCTSFLSMSKAFSSSTIRDSRHSCKTKYSVNLSKRYFYASTESIRTYIDVEGVGGT